VPTEKQYDQILSLYRESPRVLLIAKQMNLPVATVRRVLAKTYPSAEAYPPNLVRDVTLASRAGFSVKEIAERFGLSESKTKRIRSQAVATREQWPLGRRGRKLTARDDIRIRRKAREFVRALSQEENVTVRTLRARLKRAL
jgi:DNA-binding IclR family transcriptional regulator